MIKPKSTSSAQKNNAVQWLEVGSEYAGQRLDNYLKARLKGVPKSMIYRIVRKGEVRVNKGRCKPEYKLQAGDVVRVPPVRVSNKQNETKAGKGLLDHLKEAVLFENEGLMIINKPSGLAVHGGSGVSLGLIESLRQWRDELAFLELVHRLDRDTSGCVMVAKSRRYLNFLQDALREREMKKTYWALVEGVWSKKRGQVNVPLLRSQMPNGERIVKPVAEGIEGAKKSLTQFKLLETYKGASLIEAKPVTGRTHQIRVHTLYAGHPILGDEKYGQRQVNQQFKAFGLRRLFLHAQKLEITLPNGEHLTVEAPLTDELQQVLTALSRSH